MCRVSVTFTLSIHGLLSRIRNTFIQSKAQANNVYFIFSLFKSSVTHIKIGKRFDFLLKELLCLKDSNNGKKIQELIKSMVKSFELRPSTLTINSNKSKWSLVVFDYNNFDYYNHVIFVVII